MWERRGLPPCPDDTDLMMEAKDKGQSVLGVMRTFKLPGWDGFADIIPYERTDDKPVSKKRRKTKKHAVEDIEEDGDISLNVERGVDGVAEDEFGM